MKCESCSAEISNKMRAALKMNTCPFCSGKILSDKKAQQYVNLLTVLDQAIFTNKVDIDSQIKDKVVQLMLDNFVFMKLDNPEVRSDIITVPDEEELVVSKPVEVKKEKPTPPKKVDEEEEGEEGDDYPDQPTRTLPKKRTLPRPQVKGAPSMKDYIAAQNESSFDDEEEMVSDSSIDEILKVFPQLSKEEALNALRADSEMKKVKMPQRGLTGKGIKRL